MEGWRAAAALLLLAATIQIIRTAPLNEQTALDVYDGETADGCYYNFQHYGEGDRIMTNEPCLNCTCHNRMLMCYLRVCPFTKPIGQDCSVEKRGDQCCPVITCPDVPVDLLTSTSTAVPSDSTFTDVGHLDKFGCSIDGRFYAEGSKVPAAPNKPCELCYCIRNMTACVMQECTLHVDGCTPVYRRDVCCPVRYSCDHPDEDLLQLDDLTTTVRPTPGFMLTTTTPPGVTQDCIHDDNVYADGALIKTEKACEHCYCMKGDIVCVVQECGAPMENEGKNCTALAPREGQCCPDTYICEGDDETPTESTESSEASTTSDVQSSIRDDVPQKEVPVFDKYPDAQSEIPKIQDNLSEEDIIQSHIPEGQEVQNEPETAHPITTEATVVPVEEMSTSSQYIETENTVIPALSTDAKQEKISTDSTSDIAETTTVKITQTTLLPYDDIDTQKTEEIPETEYASTPENINIATKTTKRYFDQFTGITTKSLPEFHTKSDDNLIGDNVYTTHTIPSYGEEIATVTDSSSQQPLFTHDDTSESMHSLMTDVPKIQTENDYESSSETDISTRTFTSKSPSRTTPIALEPFEPTTSDQIILPESTLAPSVTDQAILEERIPAPSTFTPEIPTSKKSTDVAAPVTEQNATNDVTLQVEFEDNKVYESTTAPSSETTIVPISETDKSEDHTLNENYAAESTTEYLSDKLTHGENDNRITVSNTINDELPTTVNIDLVSTTLSSTAVIDESEKEGDDQVPILPQIPGEGDCLVDGITYINDSIIPNANKCVITCRCVSSIVHCDQVACNPPPAEMINCEPIDDGKDSCCPTYVCDQSKQTIKPESDNQMSELTSTYTPHAIEDKTTALPVKIPSVQEAENILPDSDSTTPLAVVSCDSGECQTKEELKPTVGPTEESGTIQPQSVDDVLCDTAECELTKEPQKPIQNEENGYPVVSGCSGNDCRAATELGSGDFTTSSVLSDVTTRAPNTIGEELIDSLYSTKPCDSADCEVQNGIATSVESLPTESSVITESGKTTTGGSKDCESGNCERTTTLQSSVTESTDVTVPLTIVDKEGSQESNIDKCVGDDCQVTAKKPAVKPIACSSEDCKTESDDFTPSESATIKPTGEKVDPCVTEDCQLGNDVESTSTSADCTSSECQSGIDGNTEKPSINELVCTSDNCKHSETLPVSPTSVDLISTPDILHNEVNVDDKPIAVDLCTTADCIPQGVTEIAFAESPTTDIKCTGENCISQNIPSSTPAPADVECHGDDCIRVPLDQCLSPDCSADTTGSPVTSSGPDTENVTDGSVTYPDSGTQDVSDNSVPTAGSGIQDEEGSTVTYPDGTQEVVANTVTPPEIGSQDALSSSVTPLDTDTQDVEGSTVTYPDHIIQEVTDSSITFSDLATEIVRDIPVTYPDQVTQLVTEISVPSLDSSNQDTTNKPVTTADIITVDATNNPNTAINMAEVECKDDDCVKVQKQPCLSSECLSLDVTATPIQDCDGNECVKVATPICTTPECESQAVSASVKPQNISADLGCDGNDCGPQDFSNGPVVEKKPSSTECDGDDCVKVPTLECLSPDCSSQAVTVSSMQNETATEVVCSGDDCVKAPQPEVSLQSSETHKPDTSGCDGDDCVKVPTLECSSPDCSSQAVTVSSIQNETATEVVCSGDDCVKAPQPEVSLQSSETHKPDISGCDGDDCVKEQKPDCLSSECDSQDVTAKPISEVNPENTDCDGDHCIKVEIPKCSSPDCVSSDSAAVTESQFAPSACNGDECVNLIPACTSPDCAIVDVPEVRPTVECDSGDCEIQQTTESYPKVNEDDLPKITTKADIIEVATETSTTLPTTLPNLVLNQGLSTPEVEENTPAIPESYSTTPVDHEANNDIPSTNVHNDITKVDYETERPSIDVEKTSEDNPKLSDVITTPQYVADRTAEDTVSPITTPEDVKVMTPSEILIYAEQGTNRTDSDLHTTLSPEESYGSETPTETPSSEQELSEIKPSSQDKDQPETNEVDSTTPVYIPSPDKSETTIPALSEQSIGETISHDGVSQSSTGIENEEIMSTTETIIKSPEPDGDSTESSDSEISTTNKPIIDFKESQPQTTSAQISQGMFETAQTTEIPFIPTSHKEDLDESQVSPLTPVSIVSVSEVDDDVKTTNLPIAEVTTSAPFDNADKLSDKPHSTEGINDELPINVVQDTSDKENNDNVVTVTDKLDSITAEKSTESFTEQPDEYATNKTATETSTKLDERTEETTDSDISENLPNTYSPTEPEIILTPEATTPKTDTDDDELNDILPGRDELTSTTLRPVQSTETVNIETIMPGTIESFGALSTPKQEPDITDISTVMSESVTPVAGLESDSLVTHAVETRPDVELTTTVPDLQSVTSKPTASQTDIPVSVDEPVSGGNKPVKNPIAPSKVESPNVDEDTPKPTDYYTPSSPSIDSQTVATELVPPYKQDDAESDIQQTPSSVESSTYHSGENVPVSSVPVEIAFSTEASQSTERPSVSESEITPIENASTAVPAYGSPTEILSTTSDSVTEHITTTTLDSEIEKPSDHGDETEIHVVPQESTVSPSSEKSGVTTTPENIENKYTTSSSIVANEETTSHEILSSVQPISDTSKYESTTGLPSELSVTPVSKDDNYQEISTPSENGVPTLNYEIPTDSERLTTSTTDGKISSVEINASPTPVSNLHEIITELTPTTFETNFGEEAGTTTSAPYNYDSSSHPSDEQAAEDIKQQLYGEITTISAVEDNTQQDNRSKPLDSKDVTTSNPIESENPTEEILPTHGDSNDIPQDSETSSSTPSHISLPENIETTPNPTKEEENSLLSEIPTSTQTSDLEQVFESGTIPSMIEPEIILEGSGQEPESDIYKPLHKEPTTMPAVNDSDAITEVVPANVSVDDNEPKPELESSTLINRDSNEFTTSSLAAPTTEHIAVDISDLSETSERGEIGVSNVGFTNEEEKETATDSVTSAVTSELNINVESDVSTPATHIQEEITTIAGISVQTPSTPDTFHDPTVTSDDITKPLVSDTSTPNYLDVAETEVTVQPISTSVTGDSVNFASEQTERPVVFVTETTTLSKIETPDNAGNRFGSDDNITTSSSLAIPETSAAQQTTTHPELSTVYNEEASPDDISMTTIGSLDNEIPETITKLDTDQSTVYPHSMVSEETEYFSTTPPASEEFVSLTTLLGIPTGSGLLENVTPSQITTASETVDSTGSSTGSSSEEPSPSSEPNVEKTSIGIEKTTIHPHLEVTEADLGLQPETSSIVDISKPDELTPTEGAQSTYPVEDEVQETQKPIAPDTQSNLPASGSVGIPLPGEDSDHQLTEGSFPYGQAPEDYDHEEDEQSFGPGTCRYGGKVYVSAQQIPRDDPCDFCFCFRSDIICLQQSCPPPIHGCHEEPIQGFCCPRYECPVSMATTLNVTSTTTTTTTTLPPHFLPHAYKGAAQRRGCQIKGHSYQVGENVRASSGPCLNCTCGGDGQMKCDPKVCTPEPMLRQMIAAAVSTKRRR